MYLSVYLFTIYVMIILFIYVSICLSFYHLYNDYSIYLSSRSISVMTADCFLCIFLTFCPHSPGTLLRKLTFQGKLEIQWTKFANDLQLQFIWATRQTPTTATRALSQYDLSYICSRFFDNKKTLSQQVDIAVMIDCLPFYRRIFFYTYRKRVVRKVDFIFKTHPHDFF